MNAHQRVMSQVQLSGNLSGDLSGNPSGNLSEDPSRNLCGTASPVALRLGVSGVVVRESAGGAETPVDLPAYRAAEADPFHPGAAEHLQHLSARHPEAIEVLARLCGREALAGATRVLPIALDRYGLVLRVERIRDHTDVRLPFGGRVDTGAEAAEGIRRLLAAGARRRVCGR